MLQHRNLKEVMKHCLDNVELNWNADGRAIPLIQCNNKYHCTWNNACRRQAEFYAREETEQNIIDEAVRELSYV